MTRCLVCLGSRGSLISVGKIIAPLSDFDELFIARSPLSNSPDNHHASQHCSASNSTTNPIANFTMSSPIDIKTFSPKLYAALPGLRVYLGFDIDKTVTDPTHRDPSEIVLLDGVADAINDVQQHGATYFAASTRPPQDMTDAFRGTKVNTFIFNDGCGILHNGTYTYLVDKPDLTNVLAAARQFAASRPGITVSDMHMMAGIFVNRADEPALYQECKTFLLGHVGSFEQPMKVVEYSIGLTLGPKDTPGKAKAIEYLLGTILEEQDEDVFLVVAGDDSNDEGMQRMAKKNGGLSLKVVYDEAAPVPDYADRNLYTPHGTLAFLKGLHAAQQEVANN
jgi:trehalose-6-phosphatase